MQGPPTDGYEVLLQKVLMVGEHDDTIVVYWLGGGSCVALRNNVTQLAISVPTPERGDRRGSVTDLACPP